MSSSDRPSEKYSWSFFSLMSVKGNTAIDLSLTTFRAVGCSAATCFAGQNLFANSVASATATTSPAASSIRLRRDMERAADAIPADGVIAGIISGAVGADL